VKFMPLSEFKGSFSIERLHEVQLLLSKSVILEDMLPSKIRYVAGVDVAYGNDWAIGAIAVMEYDSLNLVEAQTAWRKVTFPYIPTLLAFREVPPAVLCFKKLKIQPDVLLVDGHGRAHPYRCGFASHLGVVLGKPAIGVAKSKLIGEFENFEGDFAYLKHNGEIIGAMVRIIPARKPVYVSIGHMVSLETALRIVKNCIRNSNSPEPLRKAHQIASEEKRKIQSTN